MNSINGWIDYDYTIKSGRATFSVELNPKSLAVDGKVFHKEADRVAQEIYDTNKNVYVAFSGGIDSEYVTETFRRNGIPVTPIIFTAEDLNELDVWWAFRYCKENNIEPVVINQSIDDFTKDIISLGQQFGLRPAPGPYVINLATKYAKERGGVVVSGSGLHSPWPDVLFDQMKPTRFGYSFDDKTIQKEGYYFNLPEIITHQLCDDQPFSFFNWDPQIMYTYMMEYDTSHDSAWNKAKLMGRDPRPKNVGYPDYYWRTHPLLVAEHRRRKFLPGKLTETAWMGTREEILKILTEGR